jgi:hypothetical protein
MTEWRLFRPDVKERCKEGALQAAELRLGAVILSEAKNLGSCIFNELRRSFVACGSSG